MNVIDEPDRVFPLDASVPRLEVSRAVRLASALKPVPTSIVMGNGAFIRSWAARRLRALAIISDAGAQTSCAVNGDGRERKAQYVSASTEQGTRNRPADERPYTV